MPAPADFHDKLLAGLGGPWPEKCSLDPKVTETQQKDGYRIETLSYQAEPDDRIPAMILIPMAHPHLTLVLAFAFGTNIMANGISVKRNPQD